MRASAPAGKISCARRPARPTTSSSPCAATTSSAPPSRRAAFPPTTARPSSPPSAPPFPRTRTPLGGLQTFHAEVAEERETAEERRVSKNQVPPRAPSPPPRETSFRSRLDGDAGDAGADRAEQLVR